MAKFTGDKNVNINVDFSIDVDVHEFYDEMNDNEKNEMAHLVSEDIDILDLIGGSDRQKMYKELAYYVGNSDYLNLDYLIEELQYWSKK